MDNFFSKNNLGPFYELFENVQHPWEIVDELEGFLIELFESKKIEANFGEKIYIDPTAEIDKNTKILGPAYIGKNTKVGFGSLLRENTIILDNCVVGHATCIKNSILLNKSAAPHFNYVGDSVIGEGVNLGAGCIVANWRFDEKPIQVTYNGEKFDTGREKFGAIVGDNSKVGSNAVLNPGVLLEKECMVFPLVSAKGHHKSNSHIK